jgi:hypothetical protein
VRLRPPQNRRGRIHSGEKVEISTRLVVTFKSRREREERVGKLKTVLTRSE